MGERILGDIRAALATITTAHYYLGDHQVSVWLCRHAPLFDTVVWRAALLPPLLWVYAITSVLLIQWPTFCQPYPTTPRCRGIQASHPKVAKDSWTTMHRMSKMSCSLLFCGVLRQASPHVKSPSEALFQAYAGSYPSHPLNTHHHVFLYIYFSSMLAAQTCQAAKNSRELVYFILCESCVRIELRSMQHQRQMFLSFLWQVKFLLQNSLELLLFEPRTQKMAQQCSINQWMCLSKDLCAGQRSHGPQRQGWKRKSGPK